MVSAPCRVAPLTLQVAIALVSVTACTGDDFHPTASPASGAGGQAPAGAGGGEEAGSAGTNPAGGGGDSSGSAAATGGDGGTGPVGGGGDAGTSSAGQAGAAGGGSGGAGAAGAGAGGACEGSVATTICGGVCVDTTEDRLHCGACDVVCGASEDCVQGACGPSCASQLNEPIVDAWGFAWDGVDRAGSNFPSARGTCASLGGRLPTATEILRVSAARTKQVGKSTDTSALWTSVPASPQEQFTARLSGAGDPDKAATTMARPSRCVCPPPRTKGYGGHDCNGAAGPGCATFVRDGRQLAIDAFDRARLPLGAAEWECQSLGGALPPPAVYADLASTASGLGAGNGELHHTSDQAVTDAQVEARWGAEGTWSVGSGGFAYSAYLTAHTFRCMGPAQASPKSAAAPSNALVVPNTHVAFDAVDNAPPAPFLDAVAACFARGGHLPSSLTLFDAILAGASSGAKKPLWTADFVDPIGGTAAVGTIGWFDSAPRAALVAGVNEGVARQSVTDTNRASRCVFYPRDTAYAGPPPATCQGGCASISPAGMAAPGAGPRLWIDEEDRAAVAWTAANHQCQSLGGSLPSTRDLIEIAGAAYENASDAFLWTADLAGYLPQVITFSLSPTMPPFASGLTKQVTLAKIGEARAYRCVFTDEAR